MAVTTTKVMGEAPNVQWQGEVDNSSIPSTGKLGIAVFVGEFKRGIVDDVFSVTIADARKKLGYDAANKQYQNIINALKMGVPRVYVRRIRSAIGV